MLREAKVELVDLTSELVAVAARVDETLPEWAATLDPLCSMELEAVADVPWLSLITTEAVPPAATTSETPGAEKTVDWVGGAAKCPGMQTDVGRG